MHKPLAVAIGLALCLSVSSPVRAWSVTNWKLILDHPIQHELPLGGHVEISEFDLKAPTAFVGGYLCYRWKVCVRLVAKLKH
jgi:hypothetical protein